MDLTSASTMKTDKGKQINPNKMHKKCFAFESKRFDEKEKRPK